MKKKNYIYVTEDPCEPGELIAMFANTPTGSNMYYGTTIDYKIAEKFEKEFPQFILVESVEHLWNICNHDFSDVTIDEVLSVIKNSPNWELGIESEDGWFHTD